MTLCSKEFYQKTNYILSEPKPFFVIFWGISKNIRRFIKFCKMGEKSTNVEQFEYKIKKTKDKKVFLKYFFKFKLLFRQTPEKFNK